MSDKKDWNIVLTDQFLESLDEELTPEEQQEFLDSLAEAMSDPESFFANSVPVSIKEAEALGLGSWRLEEIERKLH